MEALQGQGGRSRSPLLRVQQGEKEVVVELTTELHSRVNAITIHTIQKRLRKGEVDLNPTRQAPILVMDRAVAVLPQKLVERTT